MPIIIKLCNHYGWYDKINDRKVHKGNIPRLGGVGFVLAFFITSFILVLTDDNSHIYQLLPVFIGGSVIFIFGILDDFIDLRAYIKFLIQLGVAVFMVLFGFSFSYFGPWELGWIGKIITVFWIIGIINAYNLIDGVDGLCGGLSFFSIITLGLLYSQKAPQTATICFLLAAAIVGFLAFNKPPAKIFMGDGGSQFLGFMIAILPLYEKTTSFDYNKLPILLVLTAIPVFDTFAAIWRRTREHRSFFSPDKSHLHHKLMNLGYSTWGILIILYVIQFSLCCAVLAASKCPNHTAAWMEFGTFIAVTIFFSIIHYTNRAVTRMHQQEQTKMNKEKSNE